MKQIFDAFDCLGIPTKEAEIYLLLLRFSTATIQTLSQNTSIPRTTLYGLLDKLTEKGLVVKHQRAGQRTYSAYPPSMLSVLLQKGKMELLQKESLIEQLIISIHRDYSGQFQWMLGAKQLKRALLAFLQRYFTADGEQPLYLALSQSFMSHYGDWLHEMLKQKRVDKKIVWLKGAADAVAEKSQSTAHLFVSSLQNSFWFYGGRLMVIVTLSGEQRGYELENVSLVEDMLSLFGVER